MASTAPMASRVIIIWLRRRSMRWLISSSSVGINVSKICEYPVSIVAVA